MIFVFDGKTLPYTIRMVTTRTSLLSIGRPDLFGNVKSVGCWSVEVLEKAMRASFRNQKLSFWGFCVKGYPVFFDYLNSSPGVEGEGVIFYLTLCIF